MTARKTTGSGASLWSEYPLTAGKTLFWHLGELYLWCRALDSEICVAHRYDGNNSTDGNPDPEVVPPDVTWLRWPIKQQPERVRLKPLAPDRAVVVAAEHPFSLNQGDQARVFLRLPLWVGLFTALPQERQLIELPMVRLSNTWFGGYTGGELCYWISSGLRNEIEPDPARPYLAICPLVIINRSSETLPVEKLCLRVKWLSLFEQGGQLWTDEMRIQFRGSYDQTEIRVTGKPPSLAKEARLVSGPRETMKANLSIKTFSNLKGLPGLGFLTS